MSSPNMSLCLAEDRFGRETRTIQVDFTEGPSIYPAVAEQLETLEVGILGKLTRKAIKNPEIYDMWTTDKCFCSSFPQSTTWG